MILFSNIVYALYYDSEPFNISEYNLTEVIERAKELGYTIRIEISSAGCKNPLPDGGCKGGDWILPNYSYINSSGEISEQAFESSGKKFYSGGLIHVRHENFEFRVYLNGNNSLAGLIQKNETLDINKTSKIIANELKELGIIDEKETIEIKFGEGYSPNTLSSTDNFSNYFNNNQLTFLIIFIIIIIIVISIILFLKRKRRTHNEK